MSVRDHLQSPPPASRIGASPWIAREDGNIPVAQVTLAMKLCPPGGNGQRYPPALRAARVRVQDGSRGVTRSTSRSTTFAAAPLCRKDNAAGARRGTRAQPAGWIDLTEMNWI